MSSAIEVLRMVQSDIDKDTIQTWSDAELIEIHKAISVALLALKQKEKAVVLLETRIEDIEETINSLEQELKTLGKEDEVIETELASCYDHLEDLKEVLKVLG